MTCAHPVYSRYLGSETDDGVEWCIAGCRDCPATMKFPAQAKLAFKYEAMREDYANGLSCTEIAEKYGYQSRGFVVNLFDRLGVKMRDRASARLMAMAKKVPPDFNPHEPVEDLGAHYAHVHKLRIPSP